MDGNQAAAYIAYRTNEVIAIYPITPASPMGELSDAWSAAGEKNLWGSTPTVIEMQSEGGAAGAVHGALQSGALTTTFTASQGLLLMLPNMYKIAGELTPAVFHIAARTIATHALSIFGDHSDVMSARMTGFALLASNSVQEAMDFALISQASTLAARIPFLHFFDGFRTSHELQKIELVPDDVIRQMIDDKLVFAHRQRGLTPDNPQIRGTAQNPDVFFQAREAGNVFYEECPAIVQESMNRFAALTGRQYHLFDYIGHPQAERLIVVMGSGAETVEETVKHLAAGGEKVGAIKVRLFRPFSTADFVAAIPDSVAALAVLDRTKEPGSAGEPLYGDVISALYEHQRMPGITIIGGRYGLSSKEFTPAMVKGIFEELQAKQPRRHFTVGINDDVGKSSVAYDPDFSIEPDNQFRALFYGLGADGTVSANKNSIKIISENTAHYTQGYFVYDSKKSGSVTISHLRFGPSPIRSPYLIQKANFIACHQWHFLEKIDVLKQAEPGAQLLLNAPYPAAEVWERLPEKIRHDIMRLKIELHVIDAYAIAQKAGLGRRINTIMQTCFFKIADILPFDKALNHIKHSIISSYGSKGEWLVEKNLAGVEQAVRMVEQVHYQPAADSREVPLEMPQHEPDTIEAVLLRIIGGQGDDLPVSALPCDGTFPSGTARLEKRNIAREIPVWDEEICIQCGKCVLVCPHAVIRSKAFDKAYLAEAPPAFKSVSARGKEWPEDTVYNIQVAPEDCTGCQLCVEICPVRNKSQAGLKALNMAPKDPLLNEEKGNWEFFLRLPENDRSQLKISSVKGAQYLQPLFEFSGACAGCGETPYIKLVTQLFGDRMMVANATGCSSIYGGNLPTTPWAKNVDGLGPSWSNSLFEDNAEFGLGFRVAVDEFESRARQLVNALTVEIGEELARELLTADQSDEAGIFAQRQRVKVLKERLQKAPSPQVTHLLSLADYLVKKSIWIIGGDGWAYDIGFGGLDHVLASGKNVNVLVLDTEVYSNTGGQMSKSTPLGATAKFAAGGKASRKKDLAMQMLSYGNVYVAGVAMGANDTQTVKAFVEAEKYDGPSLIIAYSHCIAHGYGMEDGLRQQKAAVRSGHWPLFRYNPGLLGKDGKPFILDSRGPEIPLEDYIYREARYKILTKIDPTKAQQLLEQAEADVVHKWDLYNKLSHTFDEEK